MQELQLRACVCVCVMVQFSDIVAGVSTCKPSEKVWIVIQPSGSCYTSWNDTQTESP